VETYLSSDFLGEHGKRRRVILEEIDSDIFMLALEYMYTLLTPVALPTSRVIELLVVTNTIGLAPLKAWCETTLADRMMYDSSVDVWELVRLVKTIRAEALEAACLQEIANRGRRFADGADLSLVVETVGEVLERKLVRKYNHEN